MASEKKKTHLKRKEKKIGKKGLAVKVGLTLQDLVTSHLQESGTNEADGGKDDGGGRERTIKMTTEKSGVKLLAGEKRC